MKIGDKVRVITGSLCGDGVIDVRYSDEIWIVKMDDGCFNSYYESSLLLIKEGPYVPKLFCGIKS